MIVNYFVTISLLRHQYPTVAHILIHSVNLAFGPKSGFKYKCQTRAGFVGRNGARLQLRGTSIITFANFKTQPVARRFTIKVIIKYL